MTEQPYSELVAAVRILEKDHEPDGYPCVTMAEVSRLADAVERLAQPADDDEPLSKDWVILGVAGWWVIEPGRQWAWNGWDLQLDSTNTVTIYRASQRCVVLHTRREFRQFMRLIRNAEGGGR